MKVNEIEIEVIKDSAAGRLLSEKSKSDAVKYLFDIESNANNRKIAEFIGLETLYREITKNSSFALVMEGVTVTLEVREEYKAIASAEHLQRVKKTIERSLMEGAVILKENLRDDRLMQVVDVCMPDIIGNYSQPEKTEEWQWIERNSSFAHRDNNRFGVYEFLLNLSSDLERVPDRLKVVIDVSKSLKANYILFHQGT